VPRLPLVAQHGAPVLPEFGRAERFDGLFFLDLPSAVEKGLIWQMYRKQFDIPTSQAKPTDVDWTGFQPCRFMCLTSSHRGIRSWDANTLAWISSRP
jgi:hypothetical protein